MRRWAFDEAILIDRVSPSTAAAILLAEHSNHAAASERAWWISHGCHIRPGNTAYFLTLYGDFLRQSGGRLRLVTSECPSCPGCQYLDVAVVRDGLEAVTQVLPPRARTELCRLLNRLDHDFRRRTLPDSSPRLRWTGEPLPWWHRWIYQQ